MCLLQQDIDSFFVFFYRAPGAVTWLTPSYTGISCIWMNSQHSPQKTYTMQLNGSAIPLKYQMDIA